MLGGWEAGMQGGFGSCGASSKLKEILPKADWFCQFLPETDKQKIQIILLILSKKSTEVCG
jgi:hypothetical protein